jgi:hypothetical protein
MTNAPSAPTTGVTFEEAGNTLKTIELKAFGPAKDFELSTQFYRDIGFMMASDADGIAYFHDQNVSFLRQNFDVKELAGKRIAEKYGLTLHAPAQTPWRMRDSAFLDPSGVLWRIAKNTP